MVANALADGPQVITRHGQEVVVVLLVADDRKLAAGRPKLSAFLRDSPLAEVELDLARDHSPIRNEPGL